MGFSTFRQGTELTIKGQHATLKRRLSPTVWQVEETGTGRIYEISRTDLNGLYVAGNLKFVTNHLPRRPPKADDAVSATPKIASEADWETARVRRLYVKAIQKLPDSRGPIEEAVKAIWEEMKKPEKVPGYVTVYRWKQRYLDAGEDISALLPNTSMRGNRTRRFPPEVVDIVAHAIDTVYLDLGRRTIQDTLDHAIAMVNRENTLRPATMALKAPTRRMLNTTLAEIPAFDRYAARHGRQQAVRRFRSVQAHRTTGEPLERAEIDHTPLDLMVIDDENGMPLGRPYVTACIDDYTRCLLGLYISFEPPSYLTVARCLKHAFLPKTDLRKQYPALVNEWTAHGVMGELVVDNGQEFHSTSLENACYTLGIEVHYAPRRVPWFKGKIERFLGTFNRENAHGVPGTTFSNIFEKEDYNPEKFAVVRFKTLKEAVIRWVVDVYHQRPHRTTETPPAIMWASGIEPDDIRLPDDPDSLDLILGRSEVRTLSHKGIRLWGLNYHCPALADITVKFGTNVDVEVRVDTADLGHIYVLAPDRSTAIKVPALEFDYANGISEWQHRVCKRYAANKLDQYDSAGWLEAKEQIRELIESEFLHGKRRANKRRSRYAQSNVSPKPAPPNQEHDTGPELTPQLPAPAAPAPLTPTTASAQPGPVPANFEQAVSPYPKSGDENVSKAVGNATVHSDCRNDALDFPEPTGERSPPPERKRFTPRHRDRSAFVKMELDLPPGEQPDDHLPNEGETS